MTAFRSGSARVLLVTCHLPYPPISGGRRREYELLRLLHQHCDVRLCCVSKTIDEDRENARHLTPYCRDVAVFAAAPSSAVDLPSQVRKHVSPEATAHIAAVLEKGDVDLVHVEGYYLVHLLPETASVPVVLVEQNIEYVLAHMRAVLADDLDGDLGRDYLLSRRAELAAWRRASVCAALTEEDRRVLAEAMPRRTVHLVPDGIDHSPNLEWAVGVERSSRQAAQGRILFVGNFAYSPNADAACFFVERIFPLIRKELPCTELYLVGNAPSSEVLKLGESPGIVVTGRVADLTTYYDTADVVVCPLRVGGGIKVKMLEALRLGKAVVSTLIGAQGIGGEAIMVRDEPDEFARAVLLLLMSPTLRAELGDSARRFSQTLPTWADAVGALLKAYAAALSLDNGPALLNCTALV